MPLIVLRAPAGYGKTTLATDWFEHVRRAGILAAWLNVDEDDSEPNAFAYHVAKALHHAAPHIGQPALDLIGESNLIPARTVAAAAINAIAESDDEVMLFLDDFHLVGDRVAQEVVAYLLRYAPSNFHLVVMSRNDLPLPILKLRLADAVFELEAASLRFTIAETREFLGTEATKLLGSAIERLHESTEDWPAALQLARITARNSPDVAASLRSFSGASRQISSYIQETLATQDPETIDFLLGTAVLERFNGSLSEAVTGNERAAQRLALLEQEQLLLVTLDAQRGWYRYHHLMSDFLLQRLRSTAPDRIADLHRRAYRWFASEEMWTDAVQHAIAAGDFDQALQYVEQCAMRMVVHGDLLTLLAWERKLPAELMRGQLEVKLALAWSFILVTRFAEGDALLSQIELAVDASSNPDLWWRCRAARGVMAAMSDDSDRALEIGLACQGKIPFDPFYRNALCNVLRFAYWKTGQLDAFFAQPKPDVTDGEATYVLAEQYRLCLYGMVAMQRLQAGEALALYAQARELIERYAGSKSAAAAIPTGLASIVRYEVGDVREAEVAVLDELGLIDSSVFHESFLPAYLVQARAAHLRGDAHRVRNVLHRGRQLARERGWGRVVAALLAEELRLLAGQPGYQTARHLEEEVAALRLAYPATGLSSWSDIEVSQLTCEGRIALSEHRFADAVTPLRRACEALRFADHRHGLLRAGMDLAFALGRAGRTRESQEAGAGILRLAAASGLVTFAIERAAESSTVLASCLRTDLEPAVRSHAERLLAKCREQDHAGGTSQASAGSRRVLTERKRSIVEYIAGGQSNKEIARTIGVGPETVKTHIKRIFVKLSAESRAQAVVRAQSLGLLSNLEVN